MTTLFEAIKNQTTTENGCVTNASSTNNCLDYFFTCGALRHAEGSKVANAFLSAYEENPLTALKILFYSRDIRGGQGERKTVRTCLKVLAQHDPRVAIKIVPAIPIYGRWDDLFCLFGTQAESAALELIKNNLSHPLCCKWLPREKSSKRAIAKKIRKFLKMTPKEYRKMLVRNTSVVETKMCDSQWDEINYSHVPSQAMAKYRKAFLRNDEERFSDFIEFVKSGKAKINASTLYPYQIIDKVMSEVGGSNGFWGDPETPMSAQERELLIQLWNNLPDYIGNNKSSILTVVDVSGSMSTGEDPSPLCVAVSLGLYLSERINGKFHNHFITFSGSPELVELKGDDIFSNYEQMESSNWGMNTDLSATFKLILDMALRYNLPQSELPEVVMILSDMEFDEACRAGSDDSYYRSSFSLSAFENIKAQYSAAGYKAPDIVFWNLASRNNNFPVTVHDNGSALVSGFSPSIMKSILSGAEITPLSIMSETIDSERYELIEELFDK
tara:strand:- start:1944 stop:3443 length:1500 start_codon:yes stop_codon:yes gene_type:complete